MKPPLPSIPNSSRSSTSLSTLQMVPTLSLPVLAYLVPSAWNAFSKLCLWLLPSLSSRILSKFSEHPIYSPSPITHPASSVCNLQLFHLPVSSLVYCLSPSSTVHIMEGLSVCSSSDPQHLVSVPAKTNVCSMNKFQDP